VLRRARREPRTLFIGIDAVAAAMRESSRRAGRSSVRGLSNAIFLVGAAETLPWQLAGRVDELDVALPWGSLLKGVLEPATGLVARLADTLRGGGRLTLLLSVEEADASIGLSVLDEPGLERLVAGYAAVGLACQELRPATAGDVALLSGSWGRRLGIPRQRRAHLVSFVRADGDPAARIATQPAGASSGRSWVYGSRR